MDTALPYALINTHVKCEAANMNGSWDMQTDRDFLLYSNMLCIPIANMLM